MEGYDFSINHYFPSLEEEVLSMFSGVSFETLSSGKDI